MIKKRLIQLLCFCLFFSYVFAEPLPAKADQNVIAGKVTAVLTGNIFKMDTNNGEVFVRLAGIDPPDTKQPYGKDALAALSKLIQDKVIVVRQLNLDLCGRTVGLVWLNGDQGLDISSRLVKCGAAWVYRGYTDNPLLLDLEQQARQQKLGLWALKDEDRTPPWEWRKNARMQGIESAMTCRSNQALQSEANNNAMQAAEFY